MDETDHIHRIEDYCRKNDIYFDNEGSTDRVRNINIGIQKPCKYENAIEKLRGHINLTKIRIRQCELEHENMPWTTKSVEVQKLRKKLIEEYRNAVAVLEAQE